MKKSLKLLSLCIVASLAAVVGLTSCINSDQIGDVPAPFYYRYAKNEKALNGTTWTFFAEENDIYVTKTDTSSDSSSSSGSSDSSASTEPVSKEDVVELVELPTIYFSKDGKYVYTRYYTFSVTTDYKGKIRAITQVNTPVLYDDNWNKKVGTCDISGNSLYVDLQNSTDDLGNGIVTKKSTEAKGGADYRFSGTTGVLKITYDNKVYVWINIDGIKDYKTEVEINEGAIKSSGITLTN